MRVLILCPRSDLAGVGIGIKQAFDKHSDIEVRHVARVRKVYDYPTDAGWEQRSQLIRWADVIHVMEIPGHFDGKPTVVHHHGSYYRTHGGPPGVCSTLDLELLGAGEWLPAPIDIDALQVHLKKSDSLTVAHAGTWPEEKSTFPFLEAAKRLGIEVLYIQNVTHAECLRLKGQAHIYFDQTLTGMGQNAVEAMALGIPVIAGIEPAAARARGHLIPDETPEAMAHRWGGFPFVRATEGTLYDVLRELVSSPQQREWWGQRGLAHVRRFHDERVVVRQLEEIYRRAVS